MLADHMVASVFRVGEFVVAHSSEYDLIEEVQALEEVHRAIDGGQSEARVVAKHVVTDAVDCDVSAHLPDGGEDADALGGEPMPGPADGFDGGLSVLSGWLAHGALLRMFAIIFLSCATLDVKRRAPV